MVTRQLVDSHGRRVRKLRVSLTDKCNLRCHYCMPVDSTFMNPSHYLAGEEIVTIVEDLCSFGLEELRLTGGEPLMRSGFADITARLSGLPLRKIGLTTNAVTLDRHLLHLWKDRVHHLNISLDSLQPARFKQITHGDHLPRVLRNIEQAKDQGFSIKLNMVVMKGVNADEIGDFLELSKKWQLEVRFLELMRIGYACGSQAEQFISAQEMLQQLRSRYQIDSELRELDSTSFNFKTECGAQFGFIASESQAFCGQCSRWRLSADGILRACLFKDDGLTIKGKSAGERETIYHQLLGMKPVRRPVSVFHQMNTIGG